MRRLVGRILLLIAILAVPSLDLHAQKDKKKKMDNKESAVDSSKLTGEFVGILKSVPGSDRIFLLESETKRLVYTGKGNPGRVNNNVNRILQLQNRIAQDQRQLATAKSPQQRNQAIGRLQNDRLQLGGAINQLSNTGQNGLPPGYQITTVKTEIEFQASEEVKVRTLLVPDGGLDEKGNKKKPPAEELAKLKGKDKNLPGYESALDKLEVGQKVTVTLAPAPGKKKEADKDADKDAEKKMQVKLIVVLEESKGAPAPKDKDKKK
jgi:hypothetical protein